MKLYILWSNKNKKIFAISETKKDITLFFLQNGYNKKDYSIYKITQQKIINKILITKNDLYLIDYYNFMIRECDKNSLDEIIYSQTKLIKNTIENLESINLEYIMEPKYHTILSKTIQILRNKKKKHNILKFINISEIIHGYYNNHYFRNIVNELEQWRDK